ncbi:[NiFe] hydrogenase metallocenter assembly protein HypD [Photobacterium aphoticum]|uniref:[NiFe] hydrogenase metallocenter assembly protein HypD n=1 Tax=Photobacterium aphoticum TaxID=754436 RepID=A0A090QSV5_9GAMM|nr:[NiFe] hydrogenase metallocenter assembly protein HypD [Photobacterium aphoticum]
MRYLAQLIQQEAAQLNAPLHIMEVCGGHTHTIMKFGLKACCQTTFSSFMARVVRCV